MTAKEVRKEIEKAVMEGYNNPDPEKQAEFRRRYGNGVSTPEEFIFTLSEELKDNK